jgi:hypothetical protein
MSYASSEGSSLLPPVVFPNSISVDTISPISPSTVVEFTGSGGIDANQFVGASVISTTDIGTIQCGSLIANSSIECDSIVGVSAISTTVTGTIQCGELSAIGGVTLQSLIAADGTSPVIVEGEAGISADQFVGASLISTTETGIVECGFLTCNNSIDAVTINGVLVPTFDYPVPSNAVGATGFVSLPAQVAVTDSTLVTIQSFSLGAGVWSIMAAYNAPSITTNIFVSTSSSSTSSIIFGGSYVGPVFVSDIVVLTELSTTVYILGNSVTAGFFTTGGFKYVRIA